MLDKKKTKKLIKLKKTHLKNRVFSYPTNKEFEFIDLGEEEFSIFDDLEKTQVLKIPELHEMNLEDNEINHCTYSDSVSDIHPKKKKISKEKKILIIILLICILLLTGIAWKIINWQKDNVDTEKQIEKIQEEVKVEEIKKEPEVQEITEEEKNLPNDYFDFQKVNLLNVDFNNLLKRNPDTIGWVKLEGTSINYPFVQTTDNDYYLTHSFNKKNNDSGWVYLDYRNNIHNLSQNTILYGHGRLNNTMFGSLKKVIKKSWYNNSGNHIVRISTPTENSVWQVFSTYTIDPESYYITTDFSDNQQYTDFINTLKNRSVYNYNVDVSINDHILTLSSCYDDSKRVVLHAKLISKVAR